jgi:hypothetical protein
MSSLPEKFVNETLYPTDSSEAPVENSQLLNQYKKVQLSSMQ